MVLYGCMMEDKRMPNVALEKNRYDKKSIKRLYQEIK
jgi:hypothetical protein